MPELTILHTPETRQKLQQTLFALEGLGPIVEDSALGYGAIPVTSLRGPAPATTHLASIAAARQKTLMAAMAANGIDLFDPITTPFAPDGDLSASPARVYQTYIQRIAQARHITFIDLIPSTGCGVEITKAYDWGKFLYIIHDPQIRTTRMQPLRTFHLAFTDLVAERAILAEIIGFVNQHHPCLGLRGSTPVMLGIHRQTGALVDLEEEVRNRWPDHWYDWDRLGMKDRPKLEMVCQNPKILR